MKDLGGRRSQRVTPQFQPLIQELGGQMDDRSYKKIDDSDLARLAAIAEADRNNLFRRKPDIARLYSGRLFAVALCQGAALHYLNGKNGIKDLDVWSFYAVAPERQFPYRRRAQLDFGDPKFGKTLDSPQFIGRRVDHMGRSLPADNYSDPIAVLRKYLQARRTQTAKCLAEKAVVMIWPSNLRGTIIWPEASDAKLGRFKDRI